MFAIIDYVTVEETVSNRMLLDLSMFCWLFLY